MIRIVSLLALAMVLGQAMPASAQDAALGEKTFLKCKACHQIGEGARNGVGPNLNGLIGRKSGSIEAYTYTEANKTSGLTWDEDTFRDYIKNPKAKIPGTKMVFAGIPKDEEIDNLIAYFKTFAADGKKL